MFYATGGHHLNSDDFFRARALVEREGEVSLLKKERRHFALKALPLIEKLTTFYKRRLLT